LAQRLIERFRRRLPGIEPGSDHVEFMYKETRGQIFSEYFGFPCQSFHRQLHTHQIPSVTGAIGQIVTNAPNGLSLASLQATKTTFISARQFSSIFIIHKLQLLFMRKTNQGLSESTVTLNRPQPAFAWRHSDTPGRGIR
jgi:hypothetical protein